MVCDKLLLSVKTSPVTFAVWVSLTSLIELKLNSKSTAASSWVNEPLLTEKERPETGSALLTTFIWKWFSIGSVATSPSFCVRIVAVTSTTPEKSSGGRNTRPPRVLWNVVKIAL